jgi:hypothetical protein
VRRRIGLATTVAVVASLGVGSAVAGAAAPKTEKLVCHVSLTTEPPADSNTVNQPTDQGNQYGALNCGKPGFGHGLTGDTFTVPDSGDTVGKYTQYFKAGSISGTFDITPQEASGISATSFSSQTWMGTITIKSGTGVFGLIKAKKATGVLNCTSPDSVHLSCIEKIRLTAI